MMERWFEEQAKGSALPGVVLSLLVHAAIIAFGVAETRGGVEEEEELHPFALVRFLAPPNRESGQEYQPEMVRYVSIAVPDGFIRVPETRLTPVHENPPPPIALGDDLFNAPEAPALPGTDSVYSIVDVDSAASRYEWSAAPAFPPAMLTAGIPGYVRAQWVVDSAGVADTTSLVILETSHAEFSKSVRDALPFMRFRPARIGASYVRQRVEQEFYFRITPTRADTSAPPPTVSPRTE
jgi:hypothetical protein